RHEDHGDRPARSTGARGVLSGSRPAAVPAGKRSGSCRRARSRVVSVAVPRQRPPPAREDSSAERKGARGGGLFEDFPVERGNGGGPCGPGRRLYPIEGPGSGPGGGRSRADAGSFIERGQTAARRAKITVSFWLLILRTTASTRFS